MPSPRPRAATLALLLLFAAATPASAALRLSPLFADDAVLQADLPLRVFGSAEPGDRVEVAFAGATASAVTDKTGGWSVELPAMAASAEPRVLTVTGVGDEAVTSTNVLVGEVWFCSGQSNMVWPVSQSDDADREVADSSGVAVRVFEVKREASPRPRVTLEGAWTPAGPDTTGGFSAVAYFFARDLQSELGVPVGVVVSAYSGSPIESWVSGPALEAEPAFVPVLERWHAALAAWDEPAARARHAQATAASERQQAAGTLVEVNGRVPPAPAWRDLPNLIHRPANLYNAMVAPLCGLSIRGVVWYQGEANTRSGFAYRHWLRALVVDWRDAFGRPGLPFLGVQIPEFANPQDRPLESWWAELRESQAVALDQPNAALAVTLGLGDARDIHPPHKQEVGRRLSLLALRDAYGRPVEASGPLFSSMEPSGDSLLLRFNHADGLTPADGGTIGGFALAGADRKWKNATATVEGDAVRLSSPDVPAPVAARYAWASNPVPAANLINSAGLPAGPFRTDDWTPVTEGVLLLPALDDVEEARAGLHLAAVFGDHMVLQRDREVPVFGHAAPGTRVTAMLGEATQSTETDADGAWSVSFDPLPAGGPHELAVSADRDGKEPETFTVRDILMGDVWLCAGQSNMQWPVSRSDDAEANLAAADRPQLRLMTVRENAAVDPRDDVLVEPWAVSDAESVADFSAVGYHFGVELLGTRDVPIGLIDNSAGGTRAEAWTSPDGLAAEPALDPLLAKWRGYDAAWDDATEQVLYERRRADWLPRYWAYRNDGAPQPERGPNLDSRRPDSRDHPSNLWRGMVEPLSGVPMKGVIWYQGESNANRAEQYQTLFPAMIRDWRAAWNQPDLPFLFVQIAGHGQPADGPEDDQRAELREAQAMALALPHTAMATAIDVGDTDVHPTNKLPVGHRLALAARATVYGEADLVFRGPTLREVAFNGSTARVTFDHAGSGLVARDGGPLTAFALAGADGVYHAADARIDGDAVVLGSPAVPAPVSVRYGWAGHPRMSLYNAEGLPAPPFRTDDLPLTTAGRVGPWDG